MRYNFFSESTIESYDREFILAHFVIIWYYLQFCVFHGHLVFYCNFCVFHGHLVCYCNVWYIFHALVCYTKKNLATLLVRSQPPELIEIF
jgi:hypothetical protein